MHRGLAAVVALAVVAACQAQDGTVVACSWPQAGVTLARDDAGITHVIAQSDEDALFGGGYAMARDRIAQMEVFRRQALGRSAEIFGPTFLVADLGARAFDFARLGAQDLARARAERPDDARLLEAWASGVNARLAEVRSSGEPPCGLSFVPDDWTPEQAAAVGKLLAFGLSNTLDAEILATAIRRIAPDFAATVPLVLPAYDVFTMGTPPAASRSVRRQPTTRTAPLAHPTTRVPPYRPFPFPGGHSNNWAVDGAHSLNGHPLLAGDPHQPPTSPSRFWPVHLRSVDGGGTLDVAGFSFVGTPAVELGHDERVGWTATTNFADVMDLWDVTTDAARTVVHLGDGDHPITTRDEAIFVLNDDGTLEEDDRTIEEVPGYGVLLPDAVLPLPRALLADGDAILFQWTGFQPTRELSGFFAMDRAASVDEFDAAVDLLDVGALNFVSADAQHIDYHVHALVPDRGAPAGRTMPWHVVDGADPSLLWTGAWLGPDRLPRWRDPARGYLVTGNNDPWGFTADGDVENDAFYYGSFYAMGARPYRAEQRLLARFAQGSVSMADLEAIQDDVHSPLSETLLAHLASAVAAVGNDPSLQAYVGRTDLLRLATQLTSWDGSMLASRSEPVAYDAFTWFAAKRLFEGPMSAPLFDAVASKSPPFLLAMVRNVLEARFPSAGALLPAEGEAALLLGALDDAATWLTQRFGGLDSSRYRWSDVNHVSFPTPLGAGMQAPPVAVDGASDTVHVCESAFFGSGDVPKDVMAATEVSLYRMVVGFDDAGSAHAEVSYVLGSAECLGDPHENDATAAWSDGHRTPLAFTPEEIAARTVETLTLPARAAP